MARERSLSALEAVFHLCNLPSEAHLLASLHLARVADIPLTQTTKSLPLGAGLGTVKILRHKLTGKHRVLMRREGTLKICANHQISVSTTCPPTRGRCVYVQSL